LTKDEIIGLSESLLFLFRNEEGDAYLNTVSQFLQQAFLIPMESDQFQIPKSKYRELVLAEQIIMDYFEKKFQKTFVLKSSGDTVQQTRYVAAREITEGLFSAFRLGRRREKAENPVSNSSKSPERKGDVTRKENAEAKIVDPVTLGIDEDEMEDLDDPDSLMKEGIYLSD
jgi:hypothetical protein